MSNETIKLMSILKNIEDEDYLDDYLDDIEDKYKGIDFINYLEELLKSKGINKSTIIKNADIDRTYGYQVLKGTKKPSRDKILQLCIGGNFSLEETNKALKLGNCGELYSKNRRDAVIIFGINRKLNVLQVNDLLYSRDLDCLS